MIRMCLSALAMISIPAMARAQEREPFETPPAGPLLRADVAGSRQLQPPQPIGIDAGPVKVSPALRVRAATDSNVLGSASNKRGDVFVGFEPDVTAAYGSGNLSVVARANAAITRYAKLTSQNRNGFGAGTVMRLETGSRSTASVSASFLRAYEPRLSANAAVDSVRPARFDEIKVQAALGVETASVRAAATASVSQRDYAPIASPEVARLDQSFRDARTTAFAGRIEVAIPQGVTLLADAGVSWIDARHPQPCCNRTSTSVRVMAGVRGDLTQLVSIEALGGYLRRDYDTHSFTDYSGAIWRARLEWYATPLITVALTSSRDLVSGGLPNVAGVRIDSVQMKAYYEFRRDLGFTLGLTHANESYRDAGIAVRDNAIDFEASRIFGPRRSGGGYLRWHDRESSSPRLGAAGSEFESGIWIRLAI